MNAAKSFEINKNIRPIQAAKMIGVSYSLWRQLKSGVKPLQLYQLNSIEAHEALTHKQFEELKNKRTTKNLKV